MLVLVKFRIRGNLRFLSHIETVKVFQRACARAGVKVQHSQGFNPRPKLSLPLPRSVGVESDDDLLSLRVESPVHQTRSNAFGGPSSDRGGSQSGSFDAEAFKAELSGRLPDGLELLAVDISETKTPPQPKGAAYVLAVRPEYLNDDLKANIERLLESKKLNLQRRIDAKGNTRDLDVRGFLKSIELCNQNIVVECKISSAGSIRVDEILKLLQLDVDKLTAPVRRTDVQWQ